MLNDWPWWGAASLPAPSIRAKAQNTYSSGSTCQVNVPAGTVDGDLMIALCGGDDGGGHVSYTCSGWTAVGSAGSGGGAVGCTVLYRVASSEPANYTFTASGNGVGTAAIITVKNATAVDVSGSSGTTLVAPTITTTVAKTLLLAIFASTASGVAPTLTAPSGMTEEYQNQEFLNQNQMVTSQSLTASGATGTRTAADSGAGGTKACFMVAVK